MLLGAFVFIPKHLLDPRVVWDAARITAGGLATTVVGAALLPIALPLAVIGGGAAYFAATFALRVLTPADIRLMLQHLKRR